MMVCKAGVPAIIVLTVALINTNLLQLSGPIMAARTVEQYIRAGVAGAHLEDQARKHACNSSREFHYNSRDEAPSARPLSPPVPLQYEMWLEF